jgi:hypothetical protein
LFFRVRDRGKWPSIFTRTPDGLVSGAAEDGSRRADGEIFSNVKAGIVHPLIGEALLTFPPKLL